MQKENLNIKNNNIGVTIVSLVITIIILIILAGISISAIIGNDGIVTVAKRAKENMELAQIEEQEKLAELYAQMEAEGSLGDINSYEILSKLQELEDKIEEEQGKRKELEEKIKGMSGSGSENPTGTVISYMGKTAPEGYLSCNGAVYNITAYPELAEQIKKEFGKYNYFGGDGTTTFAVPDLRGEFLRGTGTATRATGTGAAVGVHQNPTQIPGLHIDQFGNLLSANSESANSPENYDLATRLDPRNIFKRSDTDVGYGATYKYSIRPTNTSVLYCIKY